jgi:hypothetical protein
MCFVEIKNRFLKHLVDLRLIKGLTEFVIPKQRSGSFQKFYSGVTRLDIIRLSYIFTYFFVIFLSVCMGMLA